MPSKPKQPAQIRETYHRQRMPLTWGAHLDEARRLVAGWHSRLSACLVLNDDRLRAIMARLVDDGFSYAEVAWAIEAYHEHVTTDRWHIANPRAIPALEKFLREGHDGPFDRWIGEGQQLQARRDRQGCAAAARRRENQQLRAIEQLWKEFTDRPVGQRELYVQHAVAELGAKYAGRRDIASPMVRSKILQRLQREAEAAKTAPPAGQIVREVL